jgi:hypothetical protein
MGRRTAYFIDSAASAPNTASIVPLVEVTEAPLDTFVAATLSREELGDGISVGVLEGEDGSRIMSRIYNASGEECWPALLDEGHIGEAYPCLPRGAAAMTTRVRTPTPRARSRSWSCPRGARRRSQRGGREAARCLRAPPTRTLREVGKQVTPDEIHAIANTLTRVIRGGVDGADDDRRGALHDIGGVVAPESVPLVYVGFERHRAAPQPVLGDPGRRAGGGGRRPSLELVLL